ncbi:MAG: tetratricopeptide repeat protein [Bacteriovoracaceae bacterium]
MKKNLSRVAVTCIMLTSFNLFADKSVSLKRNELIDLINEEVREVSRLSKQKQGNDAKLLLRMAELYLEKARLIREEENEKYLSLDPKIRTKQPKATYFSESNKNFLYAQKVSEDIVKDFPNFKMKGDAYYILAFNAKEFNQPDKAKKYFEAAIKSSASDKNTQRRAKIALGEIYYNDGSFSKAQSLYEEALNGEKDRWWTKDALNLAWCYNRLKENQKAIDLMLKIHQLSQSSNYINMTSTVERDIGIFYVDAGQTNEAVDFYKKRGVKPTRRMISLGKYLIDKGEFTKAKLLLSEASKFASDNDEKVEANLTLMALDEKFGQYDNFHNSAKQIYELNKSAQLSEADLELYKFNIQKRAAVLQKQIGDRAGGSLSEDKVKKGNEAAFYFGVLADFSPDKKYEYYYYQGETYFAVGNYSAALQAYRQSNKSALEAKNAKFAKLSSESMLATLGKNDISKKDQDENTIYAYLSYLNTDKKSEKAHTIYQRLFNNYMAKNDIQNAEKTLISFKDNFPDDQKTTEAMLAEIMEYHHKNKNETEIKNWIKRINNKEFLISKKYADKLKALALNMQFESVEKANTSGNKKEALEGYLRIYHNEQSTDVAKKNAAYNIAVLFHEAGRPKETSIWANQALKLMAAQDVIGFDDAFLSMSASLFNYGKFDEAGVLSENIYLKLCETNSVRKNTIFKNTYVIYLADNKINEALRVVEKGKDCNIQNSFIQEAQLDILKVLVENKRLDTYKKYIGHLEKDTTKWGILIYPIFVLRNAVIEAGRKEEADELKSKILEYYEQAQKKKLEIPLEGLDSVAHFKVMELDNKVKRLQKTKLEFPEKRFNEILKDKLAQLDEVTNTALEILKMGSGKGLVKSYQLLIEAYQNTVLEINNFIPPDKPESYVTSFKESMKTLTVPLLKKSLDFLNDARKQIDDNLILSNDNYWFMSKRSVPIKMEYKSFNAGTIMDRGGQR